MTYYSYRIFKDIQVNLNNKEHQLSLRQVLFSLLRNLKSLAICKFCHRAVLHVDKSQLARL
eukprot:9824383-Ditylum_brightwellii.AAC.1